MVWNESNLHVLVVDDELEVRETLGALLEDEGFGVALAQDGVDALQLVDRLSHLDVIVCDLDMPRLDGTGLVRALRRRGHQQAVVILSGRFDLLACTSGLGQVYALAKPVDIDQLVRTLREAVEKRC